MVDDSQLASDGLAIAEALVRAKSGLLVAQTLSPKCLFAHPKVEGDLIIHFPLDLLAIGGETEDATPARNHRQTVEGAGALSAFSMAAA